MPANCVLHSYFYYSLVKVDPGTAQDGLRLRQLLDEKRAGPRLGFTGLGQITAWAFPVPKTHARSVLGSIG